MFTIIVLWFTKLVTNSDNWTEQGTIVDVLKKVMPKPSESGVVTYPEYLDALRTVKRYGKQVAKHNADIQVDMDSVSRFLRVSEDTRIKDIILTRRTKNVLDKMEGLDSSNATIGNLRNVSHAELARQKNLGKRTMFEIEELCLYIGIKMLP